MKEKGVVNQNTVQLVIARAYSSCFLQMCCDVFYQGIVVMDLKRKRSSFFTLGIKLEDPTCGIGEK